MKYLSGTSGSRVDGTDGRAHAPVAAHTAKPAAAPDRALSPARDGLAVGEPEPVSGGASIQPGGGADGTRTPGPNLARGRVTTPARRGSANGARPAPAPDAMDAAAQLPADGPSATPAGESDRGTARRPDPSPAPGALNAAALPPADSSLATPTSQSDRGTARNPVPPPAPGGAGNPEPDAATPDPTMPTVDLKDPALYLNRELTWLEFNRRVLHEAEDERTPLLERVKFLAIVSGNLDEFFMKRIGGLKQQVGAGVVELTVDGRTPQQQIDEIHLVVEEIEGRKERLLPKVLGDLAEHGIEVLNYENLEPDERDRLRAYYIENIIPLVTPQAIDPAHPFPFISNLSLNLLITLASDEGRSSCARVKVPVGAGIPRFLRVGEGHRFVPLEQVMSGNLDLLFPRMDVEACELFYVTRNANLARESENRGRSPCHDRVGSP